jgi:hypothetical protein
MAGKVLNYEILKRTFEGKTDPSKNDKALTSKYSSSKKYMAFYSVQWEHGGISEMSNDYISKREAVEDMEFKKQYGIRT